jgi:hypothetical protein
LAFAFTCASTLGAVGASASDKPPPMRFEWRVEGPAEQCGDRCRSWISAAGVITEETVRAFKSFARNTDLRGATLVLDSEGGSVLSALALGRLVRGYEMTTTVGRTTTMAPDRNGAVRATLSHKTSCESMCAFVLLAGTRRYVPAEARVLVHQIWLGSKSKRAREATYSADELNLVQRDVGRLARYTIEMGGSIELVETALRVPPWEPMHRLTTGELRRLRVTTVDHLFEPAAPAPTVTSTIPNTLTTTARGQR